MFIFDKTFTFSDTKKNLKLLANFICFFFLNVNKLVFLKRKEKLLKLLIY